MPHNGNDADKFRHAYETCMPHKRVFVFPGRNMQGENAETVL